MDFPDVQGLHHAYDTRKRICVIGAGAAGLACLKAVLDSPQYKAGEWTVTAFESREDVGGIWLPAPAVDEPPLTPLYDSLTTNLPHPVMAFTCFPFPPSTSVYPVAEVVRTYLKSFATHFNLDPFIRFGTSVLDVRRTEDNTRWLAKISSGDTLEFDLIMVANGHYRVPSYPNTPGLSRWLATRKATHSAWYRRPENFGRRILVVGDGPSARDISAEMALLPSTDVVVRSISRAPNSESGSTKIRSRVSEYCDQGRVVFEDGTIENGIDYCILATGYELSFPFLPESVLRRDIPPPVPPLPRDIYNSKAHVFPLAKHIFPLQSNIPPTSIAFIGLLTHVVPFPLFEAQARAVLYAFAHPEALDAAQEAVDIITRHETLRFRSDFPEDPLAQRKMWHHFRESEQFEYRDALHTFAKNDGVHWDPEGSVVPPWVKEAYANKEVLRRVWVELESKGEAESWVRGVGEVSPSEWVGVLKRMIQYACDHDTPAIVNSTVNGSARL